MAMIIRVYRLPYVSCICNLTALIISPENFYNIKRERQIDIFATTALGYQVYLNQKIDYIARDPRLNRRSR